MNDDIEMFVANLPKKKLIFRVLEVNHSVTLRITEGKKYIHINKRRNKLYHYNLGEKSVSLVF